MSCRRRRPAAAVRLLSSTAPSPVGCLTEQKPRGPPDFGTKRGPAFLSRVMADVSLPERCNLSEATPADLTLPCSDAPHVAPVSAEHPRAPHEGGQRRVSRTTSSTSGDPRMHSQSSPRRERSVTPR